MDDRKPDRPEPQDEFAGPTNDVNTECPAAGETGRTEAGATSPEAGADAPDAPQASAVLSEVVTIDSSEGGHGDLRAFGPVACLIAIAFAAGMGAFGWAGAIGGVLIVTPIALLVFPPRRKHHAQVYASTRWSVRYAFGVILLLILMQLIVAFGAAMSGQPLDGSSLSLVVLMTMVMAQVVLALLVLWRSLPKRGGWPALGLYRQNLAANLWTGVQAGVALSSLNVLSLKTTRSLDIWFLEGGSLQGLLFHMEEVPHGLSAFIAVALIVPFCEEILFRGVLFAALRRSRGPVVAAILSSIVFGELHAPDFLMPMMVGLALSGLFHLTGSLWAPIVAHSVFNGATAVLSFNHGELPGLLSWTDTAIVLFVLALLMLVPASVLEGSTASARTACPCCGSSWQKTARCTGCGHPGRRRLGAGVRWLCRGGAFGLILVVSFLLALVDVGLQAPYGSSWPGGVLSVKHALLHGMGRHAESTALVVQWSGDRPEDAEARIALTQELYGRTDYAGALQTLQPLLGTTEGPARISAYNLAALVLAELGGAQAGEAVRIGLEALVDSDAGNRRNIEDSLGWALARNGQVKSASTYLDRPIHTFGILTRDSIAEVCYHRGVVLMALERQGEAREVLRMGAQTGRGPFADRARDLLDGDGLPAGLIPQESEKTSGDSEPFDWTGPGRVTRSEYEWRRVLSPERFTVLRKRWTEPEFTGAYWNVTTPGTYVCSGCGIELFSSEAKLMGDHGWPAFATPLTTRSVRTTEGLEHSRSRTEVSCWSCDGHLGTLVVDDASEPESRYIVNSVALELREPQE